MFSIVLFCFPSVQAQSNFAFTSYGLEDGLRNLTIDVIGEDSTGYIWMSSPLTRFDGHTFKPIYENVSNETEIAATDISDNGKGQILFTGPQGIYAYDQTKEVLNKLKSKDYASSTRSLFNAGGELFWDITRHEITQINAITGDTVMFKWINYVNTDRYFFDNKIPGIFTYSEEEGIKLLNLNDFTIRKIESDSILTNPNVVFSKDNKDQIWLSNESALFRYDEEKSIFVELANFAYLNLDKEALRPRILNGSNDWWILTRNVVHRYDLISKRMFSFPAPFKIEENKALFFTRNAIKTEEGNLLISSPDIGFIELNKTSGQYQTFHVENTVLKSNTTILYNTSRKQVFWLTGPGQGLVKVETQTPIFKTSHILSNESPSPYDDNIRSIIQWKDHALIGSISKNRISDLQGSQIEAFPIPEELMKPYRNSGFAAAATDSNKNLLIAYWYIGEKAHVYYIDFIHNRQINLTDSLPKTSFISTGAVMQDSNNNFWIGAQGGIYQVSADSLFHNRFDLQNGSSIYHPFVAKDNTYFGVHKVHAISEDSLGTIWVGTSKGLYAIHKESGEIEHFFSNKKNKNSLNEEDIRALAIDQNNDIWIGTNGGGLNKYLQKKGIFMHYGKSEGISERTIYSLAIDKYQTLWMGTNSGLYHYDEKTGEIIQYTPKDGIQNYEFNTNAVATFDNDWLAFGGISGFNFFHPDSIQRPSIPENIVLTSFKINQEETIFSTETNVFESNQNFLSFEFSLLNYYKSEFNKYSYQLKGLSDDWVQLNYRNYISFASLKPGSYELRIRAKDYSGKWQQNELVKTFKISAPWWNTWWFYGFFLTCIGFIIYSIFRFKISQQNSIHSLRNRISKDLHDEIGSTLSSISLFGAVAQKKINIDPETTQIMLDKINEKSILVMESMNDIVWAINADHDKVKNLQMRMRAFISELKEASNVMIEFHASPFIQDKPLNMIQRRNIYLIFKESLNNAIKYAEANQIRVSLANKNNKIMLRIEDNGIGFNSELIKKQNSLSGRGIDNMTERAHELFGELVIETAPGKGTTVQLTWDAYNRP